jgi:hypothetical protein
LCLRRPSRLLCSPQCSASVGDTHQAVSVLGQTKNEGVLGVQYYLLVRTVSKFEWGGAVGGLAHNLIQLGGSMKGYFSLLDKEHGRCLGSAVVSAGGVLINQDSLCQQVFDKGKGESIIVGGCNNVLFMMEHYNCVGEKCDCYRLATTFFGDKEAAANPSTFFDICENQLPPSYFISIGHNNDILCFLAMADNSVRREVLSVGTYSVGYVL